MAVLVIGCSPVWAQSAEQRWQKTLNSEVRYYSFSSSNSAPHNSGASGGSGSQTYIPFAGQLVGRPTDEAKVEFMLRSAYVYSKQSTAAGAGVYSGLTDTTFSTALTYLGLNGIQPFASLSINMPTGTSNAAGNSQKAKADSDVVQTPAFGEGWNFGPTVGTNISINDTTMASIGVGYTNRGSFHREGATAATPTRLNPGDVTTFNGSISFRGERLSLKGTAAYSLETVTTLDSQDFYQAGDRIVLTGAAGYAFSENWSARGQLTYTHSNKNKVLLVGTNALATEAFNSNSDVYRVVVDATYAKDKFSGGPVAGYVYRNRNSYDATTYQFLPAKTSWSAGLATAYAASEVARITGRIERVWVSEGSSPNKLLDGFLVPNSAVPVSITNAWQLSLAGIIRF